MTDQPMIEPTQHPMVIAATARLAAQGGWARILMGKPLEDDQDVHDAALLVAARVLRWTPDDRLEPVELHAASDDPVALAGAMRSVLRQALRHAEGGDAGWTDHDLQIIRDQGSSSGAAGRTLADGLIAFMPNAQQVFLAGRGRFLDAGVGIGAVSRQLCESYPGTEAVGIDVLPQVVELARDEVAAAGLSASIRLRVQSIVELDDVNRFDLAWLPQAFIPRADLRPGLARIFVSLCRGGWLVSPISALPEGDAFERELSAHGARLTGGGPITVDEMSALLNAAGFVDVRPLLQADQVVMLARRP